MPLTTDTLLDRKRLKSQVKTWRFVAIIAVVLMVIALVCSSGDGAMEKDYIARIKVNGIITDDDDRLEILQKLREDAHVKGVILDIDSPGGTVTGGEILYNSLYAINKEKPLVTVMGTVAASGGYMTAIASDYIIAHQTTITGSVGVIMETAEVTDLAQKLGVHLITFKSGPLKASPSPFEKITPQIDAAINDTIQDSFHYFLTLVTDRRHLTAEQVKAISDGRIFTGNQALKIHLIDQIGGEHEALEWLYAKRHVASSLKIKDVPLKKKKQFWDDYTDSLSSIKFLSSKLFSLDGLLAIWHPV